ncbi:MAG: nicotinate phosphoribosyltransferase [Candidatus Bathyarchaeia archaeon]
MIPRRFHIATEDEIKAGQTTDVYFMRTKQVLERYGLASRRVVMEVTSGSLPRGWPWAVLCGLDEAAQLLEGLPVDVYAFAEGSVFRSVDARGVRVPLLFMEGPYSEFSIFETPLLGLLCQASGIATMAARVRKAVGDRLLVGFGIRRMHPALAPMIDRATFIGGFDGVSSLVGARTIARAAMGTMPHALVVVFGDQVKAWKAFDETMPGDVPRIALTDTLYDEKAESLMAAEALGEKLYGVRLDTPGSRKGNFASIIREVRWELDLRGYRHVKILVSGGLDDESVKELAEAGADGFGVGTSVSNAPTIDMAMDIVEVEGRPTAKRGKLAGKKQVWRCAQCLTDLVQPFAEPQPRCPRCGSQTEKMLQPLIKDGKIVSPIPEAENVREHVLKQLAKLE